MIHLLEYLPATQPSASGPADGIENVCFIAQLVKLVYYIVKKNIVKKIKLIS